MITYSAEDVKMPKIRKRDTSRWIKAVAASYGRKVGEIGYMFVNDEKMLEVNNEYLGHGILHLCGINDKGPGEREIMEANENKALALLKEMQG